MTARLPQFLEITPRVRVPGSELHLAYAASSGPGGQNVNKVASKAVLRWDVVHSAALSPGDRALALERLAPRLTTAGELVLSCDRHRDQPQNVAAVLERLKDVLRAALHRDPPRKKTKPGRGARERRLSSKKRRSEIKRGRRGGEG